MSLVSPTKFITSAQSKWSPSRPSGNLKWRSVKMCHRDSSMRFRRSESWYMEHGWKTLSPRATECAGKVFFLTHLQSFLTSCEGCCNSKSRLHHLSTSPLEESFYCRGRVISRLEIHGKYWPIRGSNAGGHTRWREGEKMGLGSKQWRRRMFNVYPC